LRLASRKNPRVVLPSLFITASLACQETREKTATKWQKKGRDFSLPSQRLSDGLKY